MPANPSFSPQHALIIRLAVGLLFGLGLAWLTDQPHTQEYVKPEIWQLAATHTLLLGVFVLWAGAGAMRRLSFAIWGIVALTLIAGISWHHAINDTGAYFGPVFSESSFLVYPFLFITHELVSSGDQARKVVAPYATYFDEAWKRGVQLALAIVFTCLFWAILWLGAALLGFIGFTWLKDLLRNEYFAWPVTGLALAASVHLGDVQPKLMAGFRALALGVLSWLLPVITLVGLVFAASLCVSGLEPLWKTRAATASLLAACVALVLLINSAYQQGDEERPVHLVMKWSARLACALMLVFAVLAAFSLVLRVQQYGLTPERILGGVGVIIALAYGLSYTIAAIWPKGRWLSLLEPINIGLAFIKAAILLAVLTPVADPGRLSAESQVSRLQSGKVTLDQFDWRVLRYDTGTYGRTELKKLTTTGKTEAIRAAALKASQYKDDERYEIPTPVEATRKTADPKQFTVVFPQGAAMPDDFWGQDSSLRIPHCATEITASPSCFAALIDLSHDGKPEVLILDNQQVAVMIRDEKRWRWVNNLYLSEVQAADFKAGKLAAQQPEFDDLKIGEAAAERVWDVRSKK